jgi:DNA-binding transcriptional ArsR family regulator
MAGPSAPPSWTRSLAAGDPERIAELTTVMQALHATVIAPEWTGVDALFDADRTGRARALCDSGVEGLLRSLRPFARWEPPVLSVTYPVDRQIRLDGRGLRLAPSFFCWASPVTLADPALPPVVLFPVDHAPALAAVSRNAHPQALGTLLGRTWARVLQTLESGTTTGELARRLTISAASASTHVRALREAGLARSTRVGAHVLHGLSPLGRALLHGGCSPTPPVPALQHRTRSPRPPVRTSHPASRAAF